METSSENSNRCKVTLFTGRGTSPLSTSGRPRTCGRFRNSFNNELLTEVVNEPLIGPLIDTLPVPICRITRAKHSCFRGFDADYGYCAATREYYDGFKLGLRISPLGMIVHYPLLQARPHDVIFLEDLVGEFRGDIIADKGFLDQQRRQALQSQGVFIRTPPRRNMKTSNGWSETFAQFRKLIGTVGSQLTQQFHLKPLKLRSFWHLRHRLIRTVLSHTICVCLNLQLHRPPLAIADLVNG